MEIIFPVVVLGGHLFECFLSDADEIEIQEVERAVLAWRNEVVNVHTVIHLLTESALASFAQEAKVTADELIEGAFAKEFWKHERRPQVRDF